MSVLKFNQSPWARQRPPVAKWLPRSTLLLLLGLSLGVWALIAWGVSWWI
jgi:hypothetical protein